MRSVRNIGSSEAEKRKAADMVPPVPLSQRNAFLLMALLPVVDAMTPQWKGLINGTVIYIALGIIAMFFVVCISKPNKP